MTVGRHDRASVDWRNGHYEGTLDATRGMTAPATDHPRFAGWDADRRTTWFYGYDHGYRNARAAMASMVQAAGAMTNAYSQGEAAGEELAAAYTPPARRSCPYNPLKSPTQHQLWQDGFWCGYNRQEKA